LEEYKMAATTIEEIIPAVVLPIPSIGRNFCQAKMALITTAATAAQGDTYTFDLASVGGTELLGVYTVYHDTLNSVLAANAVTTAVVGTTITFTIPAAGGTKARASKIYFK
jgi:hypothetical protein